LDSPVDDDYVNDSSVESLNESDSDNDSNYEKLIRATRDGKSITVYNSLENSPIDSKVSSGDLSKLEPLIGKSSVNKLEDYTENSPKENKKTFKPKQLIFISDDTDGKFLIPLPRLGHISIQHSKEDTIAYANSEKYVSVQKT
jgi:hypothetical protein